jgi:hypothetical protein
MLYPLSYERRCVASLRHLEPVLRQLPDSMIDALLRPFPSCGGAADWRGHRRSHRNPPGGAGGGLRVTRRGSWWSLLPHLLPTASAATECRYPAPAGNRRDVTLRRFYAYRCHIATVRGGPGPPRVLLLWRQ